jgi:hypothetical protein
MMHPVGGAIAREKIMKGYRIVYFSILWKRGIKKKPAISRLFLVKKM